MNHESTTEKWIQGWIVGKELVLTSIVTFRFPKNGTQCHLLVIKVVGTFVPYSLRIVCRKEKTLPRHGTVSSGGVRVFGGTLCSVSHFHKPYAVSSVKRLSCWSFALHLWEEMTRSLRLRTAIPMIIEISLADPQMNDTPLRRKSCYPPSPKNRLHR
jgi:hypothetical protein